MVREGSDELDLGNVNNLLLTWLCYSLRHPELFLLSRQQQQQQQLQPCPARLSSKVERRLISAGILREDGAEIDMEDYDETVEGETAAGVFNEIEVSDGEEAGQILEERLGFDEVRVIKIRST